MSAMTPYLFGDAPVRVLRDETGEPLLWRRMLRLRWSTIGMELPASRMFLMNGKGSHPL